MKKFAIIYGACDNGVQKKAVARLTEILLDYTLEYPVCFRAAEFTAAADFRCIYVGTAANNPAIAAVSDRPLDKAEGYRIQVKDDTVYIEGADDAGVLYGCTDFYTRYLLPIEYPHNPTLFALPPFDKPLPDADFASAPAIRDRGIWTWGHVIYDWRGFIDNMVKLKLNTIIVWNDHAPFNAREMVEYAHACNVKVIWGYSWFWDTNCAAADLSALDAGIDGIVEQYERDYVPLGGDGLYFQSFTETSRETIGGRLIAEVVTEFVNKTAARFFALHPDMELQFGLHADSVKERLSYIKNTDPRIRIVWENCGAFPFSYIPTEVGNFDATVDFVKRLTHLRDDLGGERFGAVTKGLVKLDWTKFEHLTGPMYIGESSEQLKANRIVRKHKIWKYIQAYWLTNAKYACDMMRRMAEETGGNTCVTALVEDGMFEREIMYPAALCAEFYWDGESSCEEIMNRVALRDDVTFA
ncbi:MAG: hypothetical protein IJF67_00610 [Clostridia bacterium]|nr:hypothetical protein [Clostridia bacterium]